MIYKNQVEIELPIMSVVELFDNHDNLKKWQPGLMRIENIDGEPGQVGTRSRLFFKMGKREIEMIETVTKRDLPYEYFCTYRTKGVYNVVKNKFYPLSQFRTRFETENEFRFSGWMKLLGILMPGSFKRQTQKSLNDFKKFAESEYSNRKK